MSVKLTDVLDDTGTCKVKAGKATVTLTYRVFWERQFAEGEREKAGDLDVHEYYKVVIPALVSDWDLLDAEGKPMAVTAEAMEASGIPDKFWRWCQDAVIEAIDQGKGKRGS